MAEQQNGSSPLAEALARSVTGGRYCWSRRCSAARSGSMTCSARSPGDRRDILAERLKRLERDGLLIARPYAERPPRAAYPS